MARRRQIYLVKTAGVGGSGAAPSGGGGGGGGSLVPLGELNDLATILARYNTAPDGSGPQGLGEALGMAVFYGPGFTIEMPSTTPQVQQAIISLQDEDIAWAVLGRLCKEQAWRMMDPDSGRTFG